MKIRSDYVSNSSSSSFMIVGEEFDDEKIHEFGKKHGILSEDDSSEGDCEDYDYDNWDIVEQLTKKFGLKFERGIDTYCDEWCIGLHYSDMKDSETKKEFEKRISDKLKELTGKKCDIGELVDGGMDC